MKTLTHHVLVYDKNCPLCNLYTGVFIQTDMLDKNGRVDYCALQPTELKQLDKVKARNEIALVNTETGQITYGINSLFKILGYRFPILLFVFKSPWFRLAMAKLYALVSYNRKVISPENIFQNTNSCTPSFNIKYRWAYIIFSWIFTSVVLNLFAMRLVPLVAPTNLLREWIICGGQIIFQSVSIGFMRRDRVIHYLGNMMTVSVMGALLLLPVLLIPVSLLRPEFYILLFIGVVIFMLVEHHRRARILELPIWASISWVAYRLIVLNIIL